MSKRLQYLCLSSSAFSWHALLSWKATLQVFLASGHPTKLAMQHALHINSYMLCKLCTRVGLEHPI